jgi:acyl-CoA hydrolase
VIRHVNSCFFTMVTFDDDGEPAGVPPLKPTSLEERRRHAAAEVHRKMRREMERQFTAIRTIE